MVDYSAAAADDLVDFAGIADDAEAAEHSIDRVEAGERDFVVAEEDFDEQDFVGLARADHPEEPRNRYRILNR